MNLKKISPIILFSLYSVFCHAQLNELELDSINNIYIPVDLFDSFNNINSFWNDSTKQTVASWSEEEFAGQVHMGFGMWMRNNWGLWGGSRLSKYFNNKGIYHPDDMSGIILTSYHRQLTDQAIKLKKQIKYYQGYWKAREKENEKQQKEDFKEFNIGDAVEFDYSYEFISEAQEESYMDDSCISSGLIIDKNK